jgi:hypothetical protein
MLSSRLIDAGRRSSIAPLRVQLQRAVNATNWTRFRRCMDQSAAKLQIEAPSSSEIGKQVSAEPTTGQGTFARVTGLRPFAISEKFQPMDV